MKALVVVVVCGLGMAPWATSSSLDWQDPPAVVPAPKSAPAATPAVPERHALEGVYELRSRWIDGAIEAQASRGYVAITRRHLLLCLIGPGADQDHPLVRAGVRGWQPKDEAHIVLEQRLGFYSDADGDVHIDPPVNPEVKHIELARGRLRIWQGDRSYLEFERIE